jgi:hypothetical protein
MPEWVECAGAGEKPRVYNRQGEAQCPACDRTVQVTYQTIVPHRVQRMTA